MVDSQLVARLQRSKSAVRHNMYMYLTTSSPCDNKQSLRLLKLP